MKSQLEADRKFFLEVIDDLARDAAQNAHEMEMTPEQFWAHMQREAKEFDRMFPAAAEDVEETEEETEKVTEEEAADRFRQAIARTDPKELLFHRRGGTRDRHPIPGSFGTSWHLPPADLTSPPAMSIMSAMRFCVLLCLLLLSAGLAQPREEEIEVTLRRITPNEVMDILDRFPEMVPGYSAQVKDRAGLASLFPLSEVTADPLESALPGVRFYKGLDGSTLPPFPYLMAITEDRRYRMPGGFNLLLLDCGLKVSEHNVLEMARAFVILAVGTQHVADPETGGYEKRELLSFPQIAFLNADRINEVISTRTYSAKLMVKIGDQIEEWYFERWHDGLGDVSRGTEAGQLIKQYDPPEAKHDSLR